MSIKVGGVYRHCKGGLYRVIAIAEHSETLEWHVVYQSLETGRFWVRPVSIWNSTRKGVQRFVLVDEEKDSES